VGGEHVAPSQPRANVPAPEVGDRELAADADLRILLAQASRRLGEQTACEGVAIWTTEGEVQLLAAHPEDSTPSEPLPAAALEVVRSLATATDLGGTGVAAPLAALADEGVSAAVAVHDGGRARFAILLSGGAADPPGRVRPRTLAALEAAARRLAAPVSAALAARRLARLEIGVRDLDRLAALGRLVAEIAHEIRNPLVSIKTFLQLLPERGSDPEFHRSFSDVATDELRRVERLLDAVLEQARPTVVAPEKRAVQVPPILRSVVRLVGHRAAQRGIGLEMEAPEELPLAGISEDGLRQVVLNLLLNALDVTPAGGTVWVRARSRGDRVQVAVEDEGPGVAPGLRERIFEPFFTTHPERPGGLGLTISRRIVEAAGGTLGAETRPGGGTVLLALLPVA
jgi:signal transduction histidine kinase